MTNEEMLGAMDGIFAYDVGCNSGIHDDLLRDEVQEWLGLLDQEDFRLIMSRHIRDEFLSEERLEQGYGIADVVEFTRWLSFEMGQDI